MPKFKVKWAHVFLISLGVLIGVIACNWTYFELERKITVSDLFTTVIGGYIGLYVGSKLTSKVSSDRIQKDLVIDDLKIIKNNLSRLITLFESGILPFEETISIFKITSQSLALTHEMLDFCKYNPDIKASVIAILSKVRAIHNEVTNVNPINGIISVPVVDLTRLLGELRVAQQNLFKAIITINNVEF